MEKTNASCIKNCIRIVITVITAITIFCSVPLEYSDAITVKRTPKNNGAAYKVLNRNRPKFSKRLLKKKKLQKYKKLDSLGRCTSCTVIVSRKTMPKGERGSIGMVKPTGWHTVRYSVVGEGVYGYLYNRCHLIGWQLTGKNAMRRNLITGTRYLNVTGMLPFEDRVANYVRRTGNKVLYRVRPWFKGRNMLAHGVQMEAMSIKDRGKSLRFNVYCYNKQPGVKINYSNGNSRVAGASNKAFKKSKKKTGSSKGKVYLTPTGQRYHKYKCPSIDLARSRGTLRKRSKKWCRKRGYTACHVCRP